MKSFVINPMYEEKTTEQLIDIIKAKIKINDSIKSITGIIYKITFVDIQYIHYTGKNRNKGNPEDISLSDIKLVLAILKTLETFNTSSERLKKELPRKIYKKRSPLFAILIATASLL
jgi:hypothetical protein